MKALCAMLMNVSITINKEDYCTLDKIDVIKHENNAHSVKCTDCGSFEKRKSIIKFKHYYNYKELLLWNIIQA